METRKLGKAGPAVSIIGLGCNNFGGRIDLEASRQVVHKALDAGITLFDTADVYGEDCGSEKALGKILGPRRKDIVLATKFGMPIQKGGKLDASRGYVVSAVEASLKRLNTDWIDLYQLHRPDPATPIEETLRALDDLVRQGKVRYIGCSNLPAAQVAEAEETSKRLGISAFVSCQDEYSLVVRDIERELIPTIEKYGMGLLPFFPLASGLLSGKYRRDQKPEKGTRLSYMQNHADKYMTAANWAKVEKLRGFADARGHSLLDLAFAWLLSRPTLASVIAGATKPEQVEANVHAAGWTLTLAEIRQIDDITAVA
ncbi:MAG TPA: aldo/keto reductase [Alphaproteobacteria bacterium]